MRLTRALLTLCCAVAMATLFLVPGARADEYNKLTYFTFSGPVQVPGVTLPAGTYMFKLANPDSGRRAIQIWDEKGTKLYTTLLTIPDQMAEAQDDPVVRFWEQPSGSPQAVKSWFYPADRTGYEFIYPKSQAAKIAQGANAPVLAYTDDLKSDADETAMRGTQIGRIDAQGRVAADSTAAAATATTTTAGSTTTASRAADGAAAPAAGATARAGDTPSANRTASPAPSTAAAAATTTTPSATAPTTTASTATIARSTTAGAEADAAGVGTTGTQAAQGAAVDRELPRTASPLATIELMSIVMLGSALGVGQLRRRFAENA